MGLSILKIVEHFPNTVEQVIRVPYVRRFLNRYLIRKYANCAPARPRQLSLKSNHTSWASLTDKTFTGRHLPPDLSGRRLPDLEAVNDLWRRKKGQEIPSKDTSILFAFFAQWFTDSFLRTNNDDPRRNNSNHEIDFCQLYGQTEAQTDILRLGTGGKLRYQMIDGQMYPPYLFDLSRAGADKKVFARKEFAKLHSTVELNRRLQAFDEDRAKFVFATGLEHGNNQIGYTALSVIFLREHNRICDVLSEAYPDWDDDRLFDTTRAVMTVLLLNIVLREYVAQVGIVKFPFEAEPGWPEKQEWYRDNWINLEFSLLYRWHSMVPDEFRVGTRKLSAADFRRNPQLIHELGIERILTAASTQTAGKIGLGNTHEMFFSEILPNGSSIQKQTLEIARRFNLSSMNAYRRYFGLKSIRNFRDLVDDPALAEQLSELYETPDDIEWMVGLFAEKHGKREMMGDLMVRMVAHDAFTHALTNPLLSKQIYGSQTFSDVGMNVINTTSSLRDIVVRNVNRPSDVIACFQSWKPVPGHRRFTWIARVFETADFLFVRGWRAYFFRMEAKTGSTVYRTHALMSRIAVTDALGCEVFTNWDGRLRKEEHFGVASVPKTLTGNVTPTVFRNGDIHHAYKSVYSSILEQRQEDLSTVFNRVFQRHAIQWTKDNRVHLAPKIEAFSIDFLFEWMFGIKVEPKAVASVYNNIFAHRPRWISKLNFFSSYHRRKSLQAELLVQIKASSHFANYAKLAREKGLDDSNDLANQLLFLVGMNGYLGLQSLLKSLIGEMSNQRNLADALRKDLAAKGLEATFGVIKETLRLHPPVFFLHGIADRDFELRSISGQFRILRGERLIGVVPLVQQSDDAFKDPMQFNPNRADTPAARASMIWAHARHDAQVQSSDHGCPGKDTSLLIAGLFLEAVLTDYDWRLSKSAKWNYRRYSLNVAAPKGRLETRYFRSIDSEIT